MRNEMTIDLARPPAAVFPYIEDSDKLPLWLSGFVAAHTTDPVPSDNPSTFRHVMEFGGRLIALEGRMIACEPGRHLAFQLKSRVGDMRIEYRLDEEPGGTRLSYTCDSELTGFMRRLFSPVFQRLLQSKIERDLVRLKEVVEAERPAVLHA
jgi:carbon monoxide dehydrogenase subunit G